MGKESYEKETSRKRPLVEEDITDGKRSNGYGPKKPALKILIPNMFAGKLIGKGGSKITELEAKHNVSIQVSPSKEFYPRTEERFVIISAEVDQIIEFCGNMIENILVEEKTSASCEFKIVATNTAVGLVIGKGGSIIKVIQEETQAKIHIAKQDESAVHGERVIRICGSPEQQYDACKQIIERMSTEPMRMSNDNRKYDGYNSGSTIIGNSPMYNNPVNMGYGMNQQQMATNNYDASSYRQKSSVKSTHMVEMEIPNIMVGAIVGRQGQTINEITRSSGAKINFSGKDEFAPGTTDRILTITGGKHEVDTAFVLVDQKMAQVENEFRSKTFL